tara:strand:- start:341 stop:1111 length:771 start_codon:yes stop_codon:yes gene_type:complete
VRRLTTFDHVAPHVVAVADGVTVMVRERLARETLGGERGPPTADAAAGGRDLTGVRVWEAAPYLIRHLSRHRERLLHGRTVIDLGAGTGAVGLAAAAYGARHVVLSDIDSTASMATHQGWEERSTLEALAENVTQLNRWATDTVSVAELRWGDGEHLAALRKAWPHGFDTVVASDLLYYPPETYGALAETIRAVAAAADTSVVLSYRVRHGQEHTFVDLLREGGEFECTRRGAADEASLSASSHATRVVELSRLNT